MTAVEKIERGILVALETPGHWRDLGIVYEFVNAKYRPHQGRKECDRRINQQTRVSQ